MCVWGERETAVDRSGLSRHQKLRMYKLGICPRLSWLLSIQEFSLTWIERELEAPATKFLKRWSGLAKSATPNRLYLSRQNGGLSLPAISTLYKKYQSSRQCKLLTSTDPTVRKLAEDHHRSESLLTRKKFKPTEVVIDAMKEDPAYNRKTLKSVVKRTCNDGDEHVRKDHLCQLTRQGVMNWISTSSSAVVWAEALEGLPPETFKFALNASHDTLPHNANLSLWGKKISDQCLLCGERQSLIHVLNACIKALELRRYNERHDAVLSELHQRIKEYLPPSITSIVDLEDYQFPQHIAHTDLRPDIVCWDENQKRLCSLS